MNKIVTLSVYRKVKLLNDLSTVVRNSLLLIALYFSTAFSNPSYSQNKLDIKVDNVTLEDLFKEIQSKSEYIFFYEDKALAQNNVKVSLKQKQATLPAILDQAFTNTNLSYTIDDRQVAIKENTEQQQATVVENKTQGFSVQGRVLDNNGTPLPGVNIVVKGTATGTSTDIDGNYAITVPNNQSVLVYSFLGFTTQEVTVGNQSTINVSLQEDSEALEEVVVVGYGTQKKSDLTGSVGSISSKSISKKPSLNPTDALTGQVAGVSVFNGSGRPGGGYRVRIRGSGSINASNSPLIVIDGFVGGSLDILNPNDIESMNVLKDASSTAIYGAQGANGVVIITTKKAKRGSVSVTFDSNFGFGVLAKKVDFLSADQFIQQRIELNADIIARNPSQASNIIPYDGTLYPDLFNPDNTAKFNTDWQDQATQTAFSERYFLSVTGGSENFSGGMTFGYQKEEGLFLNTFGEKTTARFFGEYKISDNVKLGGALNFGQNVTNHADQYSTADFPPARAIHEFPNIFPIRNANGNYSSLEDLLKPDGSTEIFPGVFNPVAILKDGVDRSFVDNQLIGNVFIDVKLAEGLSVKTTYGRQYLFNNLRAYASRIFNRGLQKQNFANLDNDVANNWQLETLLTYKWQSDKHSIGGNLGASWYGNQRNSSTIEATNFADDFFGYNNVSEGTNVPKVTSQYTADKTNSYFARGNYSYDDKYLATLTLRYDGSSRFGANNRYALFPSAAFGWKVSNEEFLTGSNSISNLKLRVGYGQTGNNAIGDYAALGSPYSQTLVFNGGKEIGSTQGTLPNPDLEWEKTKEINFGIDLGLFNRINVTADFYRKETTDLLFNKPVPSFTGYTNQLTNIGAVENKGFELGLNTTNIATSSFSWGSTINFTTNKNKVLALGNNNEDVFFGFFGFPTNIFRVGEPAAAFWGHQREIAWGTNQVAEAALYGRAPGDIRLEDVNNDKKYDRKDQRIIGNPNPDYEVSFINNISYKNWDFSIDILFSKGADILSLPILLNVDRQKYSNGYAEFFEQRWTPDNQNTIYSRVRENIQQFSSFDTGHIFDGSFIRGRNMSLSYGLPIEATEKIGFKKLQFYANLQNFFLITDYFGWDPEVSSDDNNQFAQGFDFYSYPKARTLTFGVKVNF